MTTLTDLARACQTDKFQHGYCPAYEFILGPVREDPITLVEIGVLGGASLRMWETWMPRATIIGVDNFPACAEVPHGARSSIVVSDILDWQPADLVDIVIDDGSHHAPDVIGAFLRLWPWVRPGGWYIIEDCATQWLAEYEGDPTGSVVVTLAESLMECLLREAPETKDAGAVSDLHVWRQMLAMRKRELRSDEPLPDPTVSAVFGEDPGELREVGRY